MIFIVDRKFVFLMFFSLFSNYVMIETAINNNNMDPHTKQTKNNSTNSDNSLGGAENEKTFEPDECPSMIECSALKNPCIKCQTNKSCIYGELMNATCEVASDKIKCLGNTTFQRPYICRYCFLTEHWEHDCVQKSNCMSHSTYKTNCSVHNDVICLGSRQFSKNVRCNFTRGVKYRTALILSIVFGGFGVDRFYLGFWQEGIGKLFSFGGLGVWVIIDTILIAIGYLGTSDESLLM